jgi:uracil-DNA glycosylase
MDLYSHTKQNVPKGWEELFRIADPEIKQISDLLNKEKSKGFRITPEMENIFRVFHMCKPENIRVIILGQDPYAQVLPSGKLKALGFSFSVSKEDAIPSSLHNIYKEVKNNYPSCIIPKHGDISDWVSQGVFLLNSCLTCRVNEPGSHTKYKIWLPFIDRFLKYLSSVNKDVIFALWGKDAQQFETMIEKGFKNILKAVHPSGLSASRGFFGCGHFKQINDIIISVNKKNNTKYLPIKWLEKEKTLSETYIQHFSKETNIEEMEHLKSHYLKSYEEVKHNFEFTLEEYTIYAMSMTVYSQSKREETYEDFLGVLKEDFDSEDNHSKSFHSILVKG